VRENGQLFTLSGVLEMEYETAKELMENLRAIDGPINGAMAAAERIQDPECCRAVRKALATVVGMIYTDLMAPIAKESPDLAPPE
jgi:hypothetical protein